MPNIVSYNICLHRSGSIVTILSELHGRKNNFKRGKKIDCGERKVVWNYKYE
jgi:hypothetical protein